MSTEKNFSLRINRYLLGGWLIMGLLNTFLLRYYNLPWEIASIDAVFSIGSLFIASLIVTTSLKYYRPERGHYFYVGGWVIIMSGIWVALSYFLLDWLIGEATDYHNFLLTTLPVRGAFAVLMLGWTAVLTEVWYSQKDLREQQQRQADAEKLAREAELFHLRQQLQPHFLFNSLNSISALAGSRTEEARKMIHQLSDFLRGTLKKDDQKPVPLAEELEHLGLYLEIEKVRFGHRLRTEIDADELCRALLIPPMLLQPIVENAIKFGLYDTTGEVNIRLKADCVGHMLVVSVENPYDPQTTRPKTGTGFGLSGIRRRLYLLFGRTDLLETSGSEHIFTTTVKIPQ